MRRLAIALVFALAAIAPVAAPAADWPTRPIRIIAPSTPGGAADMFGRLLCEHFSETFGERCFVENRAGAGGLIGTAATAQAAPDGYTLTTSSTAYHVIAPAVSPNPGFDPIKDFTHIAYIGGSPIVITTHASLGVKSLAELVALVRGSANAVGYVSPGVGSLGHMVGEYLARKDRIRLDGHVKVGAMTWTTARAHIRAGTLVALALSSNERFAQYPDLPTLKELGYDELVTTTWWSFSGPARLPADLVQRLNREINKALDGAEVRRRLEQEAIVTEKMTPEQFTRFVETEIGKWGPLAKTAISPRGSGN